jgi:hypothetical protein
MTYLFDNCISYRFAHMLSALGVDVKALRDVFPADIKDVDFIPQLHGRGWILITTDRHMKTRQIEAAALQASGVTALFLGRFYGKLSFWQQARWLVTHWPEITDFAERVSAGTVAEIQQNGTARMLR